MKAHKGIQRTFKLHGIFVMYISTLLKSISRTQLIFPRSFDTDMEGIFFYLKVPDDYRNPCVYICFNLQDASIVRSFSKLYSLLKNGVWDWWHWTKITNHQKCWSMMVFIFISIFLNYTCTRIKCKVQLSNSRYTYKFEYIYASICQLRVSRRKRFQVTNMQ